MTVATLSDFTGVGSVTYDGRELKQVISNGEQIWPNSLIVLPPDPTVGSVFSFEKPAIAVLVAYNRRGFKIHIDSSLVDRAKWSGLEMCVALNRGGSWIPINYVFDGHATTMVTTSVGYPENIPAVVLSVPSDPYLDCTGRNIQKGDSIRVGYIYHGQGMMGNAVKVFSGVFNELLVV